MDERKRIEPSRKCPKCGCYVDSRELAANGGTCQQCYPAAGFVVGVYQEKGARK